MMNKKLSTLLLVIVLGLSLILSGCNSKTTQGTAGENKDTKVYTLKLTDYAPNTNFLSVNCTQVFIKKVEELTNGRVKIQYFPGGQLGKPTDFIELVQTKGADIGNASQSILATKMPLLAVLALPGMVDSMVQGTKAAYEVVNSSPVDQEFKRNGIKPLFAYWAGPYEILTSKKQIKTVADLKGLKIRSQGGDVANAHIEKLGAVPVTMSAGDMYEGLQKGVVDGIFISNNSIPSYKLDEVAKYQTTGVDGTAALMFAFINEEVWNSFPSDIQEQITQAAKFAMENIDSAWIKNDVDLISRLEEKITFTDVDRAEFKKIADPVITEWIKKSESKGLPAQKAFDVTKAALEKYKQ